MTRSVPAPVPPRLTGDGGSVLPEFALVAPFIIFLVLGIFEFGTVWRNSNILGASLRTAARSGAQAQNSATADMVALQSYLGSIAQSRNVVTNKIIIFRVFEAANPTAVVPSSCVSASTSGSPPYGVNTSTVKCNVYVPAQWAPANLVAANFGCGAGDYDVNWCPTTRSNALTGAGPDTLGIWATVTYTYMTKLLPGGTLTITDRASSRIEPASA